MQIVDRSSIVSEVFEHYSPVVIVDSLGAIIWRNECCASMIHSDENITECLPELDINALMKNTNTMFVSLKGTSYVLNSYPLKSKRGAILYFETVLTKTVGMLFENHYEGFILIDHEGIIRLTNQTLADYLKRPQSELINKHFSECNIDPRLGHVLENRLPDLLSVVSSHRNIVASRHPVFVRGKFIGVYGRYFSLDSRDLKENVFGDGYVDILNGLQISGLNQAVLELNVYRQEQHVQRIKNSGIENLIGDSPAMRKLKKHIVAVSESPSSILLTGESGTGKELCARAIHFHSNRSAHPFVKINCAAIPDPLLEAELFGYVGGAFTDAAKGGKVGKFELANKGILFLDEIGDMSLSMQAKLLRVLQEGEVDRLGSNHVISVDVRILSATNKDLYAMIAEGTFRADLFYRLNVINFHMPALKDRTDDLPDLIGHFLKVLNVRLKRNIKYLSSEVTNLFLNYDWPGNIRELFNVLESSMNFCHGDTLGRSELPHYFVAHYFDNNLEGEGLQLSVQHLKKSEIHAALQKGGGKRKVAAEILGVSKSTLYRLMKKHNVL